jgi:serine protease AprX
MVKSSERGSNRDLRSSALWGTGGRGGDSRSSALWGKGGRGFVLTAVAIFALAAPLAATASPKDSGGIPNASASGNGNGKGNDNTWVSPDLRDRANKKPNELTRVIVQSTSGATDAQTKVKGLGPLAKLGKRLDLVNGVAVELPARLIDRLSNVKGLQITPDAPARASGSIVPTSSPSSTQLWPYENGDSYFWNSSLKLPTIAIVDSGIDKDRADFDGGARVLAQVNLSTLPNNSAGDGRGHGTFVAGIAAGSARGYAGAAPKANLVALDVMDDQGMARTSDVIAAANWILQNKDAYNIKVANFSLHSTYPSNFGHDPLDQAVEKLWFAGVTVVAAAGNYGNADGTPSGVHYAPGNDPFVITVGALDLGTSARVRDDSIASWSAWGTTYDGFMKPEISAAGRYMVGPVPAGSTLPAERPDKVTAPGYMELSGTSFAAPVVSGTAAYLIALNPSWTPDQVKGALMATAQPVPNAQRFQAGVGQVNAVRAMMKRNPPNPNKGLDRFVVPDAAGGLVFDAVSWYDAAKSDVSWNSVSWADVSWSDVSWNSVSWADVSWSSVSWSDVSWSDVSWADVSWADSSREDAVEGETGGDTGGIALDAQDATDIAADPSLNPDPSLLDPSVFDTTSTLTSAVTNVLP